METARVGQQQRQPAGEGSAPRIPELETEGSRTDTIMIGRGGSYGEWAKLRYAVRKWVHEQTRGAKSGDGKEPVGANIISPTQVLRVVKRL